MTLFSEAKPEMAYLKGSIHGFSASGKSFTATMIAIALHKYLKSKKPIFFLDTETGSDFMRKYFERAGIRLERAKSRAFIDLLGAVKEAESGGEILVIDSITHFWTELVAAYKKKKNKNRLTIKDWGEIKPEWYQFTDRYLSSRLHILMLGRAGWEFDMEEDDEGAKELTKTGTKMKVETDIAYEPSLSLEMQNIRKEKGKIGGNYKHRCWVIKDRFNLINGEFRDFDSVEDKDIDLSETNPIFKFILPHVESLNLGGEHKALDLTRNSTEMFNSDHSAYEKQKRREIILEEIEAQISLKFPGRDVASQNAKIHLLEDIFKTTSWTAVKNLPYEALAGGMVKLRDLPNMEVSKK